MVAFMITLLIILGCIWITFAIHEFGHALALILMRQNVICIHIGALFKPVLKIPIRFKRIDLDLLFSPYFWEGGTFPDWNMFSEKQPKKSILIITFLAGPIASLTVTVIAYICNGMPNLINLINYHRHHGIKSIAFWEWFCLTNILIGFGAQIFPSPGSDGDRLLRVLRGKELR